MKRSAVIVGSLIICVIAGAVYFNTRTPPGVTAMDGEGSVSIAWISLAIAVLSLATAIIGLIHRLVELKAAKGS